MVNITLVCEAGREPGHLHYSIRTPDGTRYELGSTINGLIASPRFNQTLGMMHVHLHPNSRPWNEIPGTKTRQQGILVPNDHLETLIKLSQALQGYRQAS